MMAHPEQHQRRNDFFRNASTSLAEARRGTASTREVVRDTCEAHTIPYCTQSVPDSHGANIVWLGSSPHQNVLLYCHGKYKSQT